MTTIELIVLAALLLFFKVQALNILNPNKLVPIGQVDKKTLEFVDYLSLNGKNYKSRADFNLHL